MKYIGHLKCPNGVPYFGNAFQFIGKNTEGKNIINQISINWYNLHELWLEIMHEAAVFVSSNKTPFYGWFLGYLIMIIDRPEDVQAVLTSKFCIEKALIYRFFHWGSSLLTAPGNRKENLNLFKMIIFYRYYFRTYLASTT